MSQEILNVTERNRVTVGRKVAIVCEGGQVSIIELSFKTKELAELFFRQSHPVIIQVGGPDVRK